MPGPTNTFLAASGTVVGFRRSLILMPAELVGYTTAILIATAFAGAIHGHWPTIVLPACVVLYLVGLAVDLWRDRRGSTASQCLIGPKEVFLTTLLNPKALLFAFVLMPRGDQWWPHFVVLGGLIAAMSLAWASFGKAVKRGLVSCDVPFIVGRVGACVITFFAAALAWPLVIEAFSA